MKKIILMLMPTIILIFLGGCDTGLKIVNLEIITPPDRIVYIANVDTEVDLRGCIAIETIRQGNKEEIEAKYAYIRVNHSIDFSTPGVYEVEIIWNLKSKVIYKFLVQVINDEIYESLKNGTGVEKEPE